jgi:hypothetical protein
MRTIPGSLRVTYGRPSSPETLHHKFFPRRKMRLPRGRFAPKTCVFGSSTTLRPNKVQAAGGGHLRSSIAGEWFPSEHPIGDFK